MRNLSNCPHCGRKPNVSRMLDDVVIECLNDDLVAQAADHAEAAIAWNQIVEIRINAKNLTQDVTA